MHCGYLKEEGDKMEHLERHGFLRRGIARHARLSLQLRNQSARTHAQSAVLAAPQLTILATWGGLSRLLAPGCATHYSGRAAGPRKAHWEAAMRP